MLSPVLRQGANIKTLAQRFYELFKGLDRAHGFYALSPDAKPNAKGKLEAEYGKGRNTKNGPPTVELWEEHLRGGSGLGIVPICSDNTCTWGAGDIDIYPLDLKKLVRECRRLKLPVVICRTKSGGAHMYLFLTKPAPAELVRNKIDEWMAALGYAGCEVFPKQTRLASENDYGSWLNMPYQGGIKTTRYAIADDGTALSAEDFLALVSRTAIDPAALAGVDVHDEFDNILEGAPPCLVALAKRGFPEGTRNNALFNIGVYLKKRYGEGWVEHFDTYNQKFMRPPLASAEVVQIQKSVAKKNYSYRCKDQPIAPVCSRRLCLTKAFGIGGLPDDPGVVFGPLVKLETQPATWIWDVDGARIELQTSELMNQIKFHERVIEQLNKWPQLIKANTWQDIIREKLGAAEIIKVPEDATREGQLWVHLHKFCTSRLKGRSLDELLMGKPYTDKEKEVTYFCAADFLAYLTQHRVTGVNERDLYKWLRKRGVNHHFKVIKGKGMNYWSVKAFTEQTEEFEVPQAKQEYEQ